MAHVYSYDLFLVILFYVKLKSNSKKIRLEKVRNYHITKINITHNH